MKNIHDYQFWFIVGSQDLYGPETLEQVDAHSRIMAESFDHDPHIPSRVIFSGVVTTSEEITAVMERANNDPDCAGVITWMHTFSPSKMWIRGLSLLNKPYLHLNTQFNRTIPFDSIDMDFMNLNQSAHGDREHGFISARLRKPRKVIAGFWEDEEMRFRMGAWMRSAIGVVESKKLKVARFGDNMREVAVTEGDKVEAQKVFGWSVNTYGIGGLVEMIDQVTPAQTDAKMQEYQTKYQINTEDLEAVRYQAKIEVALETFLNEGDFGAYSDSFEDLYGMKQLPGLATQNLMSKGFGFGAEGDWKSAAMLRVMKLMGQGLEGGASFMEDYTYHLEQGNELVLGAHMLEICPSIASGKPAIQVNPLGIGGKEAPARLVFDGSEGSAILVTVTDMGNRFRMIAHDIEAMAPIKNMPKLPVARLMWKAMPDTLTGAECWIYAGGAHHSVISYALTAEQMQDYAEMLGIEFIHISKNSKVASLKRELEINELIWKMK